MPNIYEKIFPRQHREEHVGDCYRDIVKMKRSSNGNRFFEVVGKTNVYALTQSFKDVCSIENIIKRATNDPSVLHATNGVYLDMTEMPKDMNECFEVINNAKAVFENLSQAERDSYSDSFTNFLGSFSTPAGLAKFVNGKKVENTTVESEVINNAEHA